jgi:integrase/recombinase XerD
MDSFLVGNITGSVYLDTRRPKIEGNFTYYPVKARITINRERLYISMGFDLTEEDFNNLEKTKKTSLIEVKKLIAASFGRIKKAVEDLHKTEEYTHDKLRNKLRKGRKAYLDAAFENKISELTKNGQAGTAASYTTARNFINKYATDLRFVDITPQWLSKFEAWALRKDVGINETSLGIYLRYVRTLFNDAIRSGDVPRGAYPFYSKDTEGYKIPTGEGTKIALTVEQMNKIATLELTGSPERCRDMFLLSFHLGGINFKDMLLLKWKNIKGGEVHFIREKTKNTNRTSKSISVPYTDNAKRIIDKWGNADKSPEAYVIPYMVEDKTAAEQHNLVKWFVRNVNKQLSKIGKDIGIDGLSTYVARHSVATILKNSGAPIAFIGETLGHSSTKTTESYLKSFESDQKRKHFEVLTNIG